MTPHAAQALNRFQVGEDGRRAHYRLHLKNGRRKNFRIRRTSAREAQKAEQNHHAHNVRCKIQRGATWVGYSGNSSRTPMPPGRSRRWVPPSKSEQQNQGHHLNAGMLKPSEASSQLLTHPTPKDPSQLDPRREREKWIRFWSHRRTGLAEAACAD